MAVPAILKKLFIPFYLLAGYVFVLSGLIVCFLMFLTFIFVWPFNRHLYRKIVMMIAYSLWSQFTFIAQWWSESDCTVVMDNDEEFAKLGIEHTMVLMNHKYDVDWLITWILAERYGLLGGTKIFGKSTLRMIPIIGWAWIFTESIFLKREWEKDKKIIAHDLQFVTDYPDNYWVTLLLFCEGTRFTEEKHQQSLEFARKKGLPELKHHLLPRSKGFIQSMHGLQGKIPAILDITIAFDEVNYARPTLLSVLQGKPLHAEMYIRRIPTESVPTETDEACSNWLLKLFQEKDEFYDNFVKNNTFTFGKKYKIPKRSYDIIIWFLWATVLSIPLVYYAMRIITSGSLLLQVSTVAILFLIYKGIRAMIAVSETEKGSSYGKHANGKKKD